ncbi:hypothetical protein F2Q69_00033688 [Brassica cretica]|uniref:Uncharacterized protein n=1 Tax=Brassica cretica TaxID=69181 RepID=A0A8S9SBZ3_BRACR|nr:hypothetical protein F2Q69_00033688 [Brassica cretica]
MVRGDAPVRSSDLRTSVSWLKDKLDKGREQAQPADDSMELAYSVLGSSLELID